LILKKEGMGFGDVKLAFAVGFLLGWQRFIFALLVASVLASVVLVIIRAARHDESGHEYPFGPFFSVGTAVALLCGETVIEWYIGLLPF
jgi:leader peptidase (prepilin peptidase)/N-methyltransferase